MSLKNHIKIFFILCFTAVTFAQPELEVKPHKIDFEDIFNRLKSTYLVNKGDQTLSIDSLVFNPEFYLIDFENNQQLPFTIAPDDSVKMNVMLTNFPFVTVDDTTDTIYIYNNGIHNPENLEVEIEFFEDHFGTINGQVSDIGGTPLPNSYVYFFYEGIIELDMAITDGAGNYTITLPEGNYTVAAESEGYHPMFYNNRFDPYFADFVELSDGQVLTIDFSMQAITDTNIAISGLVKDSTDAYPIDRGIVVVRKGTHVPNMAPVGTNAFGDVFAGFVKPDGTYKVYMEAPDYYYVQAYTNYFLPGYYNEQGNASVYWTEGDSVLIDNNIVNKNINLARDSSYGGGLISGSINFQNYSPTANDYDGITLLVRSIDTDAFYSYNFGKETGVYSVAQIPYGTYEVVAQKIGFDNAVSQIVTIDPVNTQYLNIDIFFNVTGVNDQQDIIPQDVVLNPSYPNPFNPSTNISFKLPEGSDVQLVIMNILGETVKVLLDSYMPAGNYNYNFVANGLSSGVYLVMLQAGNTVKTQKIVLMK